MQQCLRKLEQTLTQSLAVSFSKRTLPGRCTSEDFQLVTRLLNRNSKLKKSYCYRLLQAAPGHFLQHHSLGLCRLLPSSSINVSVATAYLLLFTYYKEASVGFCALRNNLNKLYLLK